MLAAFDQLGRERKIEVLRAIRDERIPLVRVADLSRQGKLDEIGVDLSAYVGRWQEWARRTANERTVAGYLLHVRRLIPEGQRFPRSQFTCSFLSRAAGRLRCSDLTVRRYLVSWGSFAAFLFERGLMDHNPIRSLQWPRRGSQSVRDSAT